MLNIPIGKTDFTLQCSEADKVAGQSVASSIDDALAHIMIESGRAYSCDYQKIMAYMRAKGTAFLLQHFSDNNVRAVADDNGRAIRFNVNCADLPRWTQKMVSAHEFGHLLQNSNGDVFAHRGEAEEANDRWLQSIGIDPFGLDDFILGTWQQLHVGRSVDAEAARLRRHGGRYHRGYGQSECLISQEPIYATRNAGSNSEAKPWKPTVPDSKISRLRTLAQLAIIDGLNAKTKAEYEGLRTELAGVRLFSEA